MLKSDLMKYLSKEPTLSALDLSNITGKNTFTTNSIIILDNDYCLGDYFYDLYNEGLLSGGYFVGDKSFVVTIPVDYFDEINTNDSYSANLVMISKNYITLGLNVTFEYLDSSKQVIDIHEDKASYVRLTLTSSISMPSIEEQNSSSNVMIEINKTSLILG